MISIIKIHQEMISVEVYLESGLDSLLAFEARCEAIDSNTSLDQNWKQHFLVYMQGND